MLIQEFKDTQPTNEPNTSVDYRDPTDVDEVQDEIKYGIIDPISRTFATWIRTKMYRRHVRESLARMMEYTSVLFNKIKLLTENTEKRQSEIEKRQTTIEENFKSVIANATVDSELINARSSEKYGDFATLDERLEYIEKILSSSIPDGFDVTIEHNLGVNPLIVVRTWTYGIGVVPLGTEPEGFFGGSAPISVPCSVKQISSNKCVVTIPKDYKTIYLPNKINDNKYLIIDEENNRSIVFDLSI
ncbi:hypothetical protein [Enterococcus faecium]|uniref:hypothetical protein n=1 Tax=Enterococcus TaxID=1350 RepID=UPI0022E967CE|nr:hypothetical protein [Enterococcus faecium]